MMRVIPILQSRNVDLANAKSQDFVTKRVVLQRPSRGRSELKDGFGGNVGLVEGFALENDAPEQATSVFLQEFLENGIGAGRAAVEHRLATV